MIKENKNIKNFELPLSSGKNFKLFKNLKKNLVLFIYPKDNTPGCTKESIDFAKNYLKFKKLKTEVIGVSKDSIESHIKFKKKFKFPFELISDEKKILIKMLGAWGKKLCMEKNLWELKEQQF